MARPNKQGLDYFPLDVDMDQEAAIAFLESKHGTIAFAVIVKLLMRIYRNGYYLEWGDREKYVMARHMGIDADVAEAVITDAVTEGLFDADKFEHYSILTSRGIQRRWAEATKRRAGLSVYKEYAVNGVFVGNNNINLVSVNDNQGLCPTETSQSKVKERKVKESSTRAAVTAPEEGPAGAVRSGGYSLPECMQQSLRISAPEPYKGTCAGFVGEAITARYGLVGPSDMNLLAQAITDGCLEGCKGENAAACAVHLVGKMAKAAPTVRQSTLMLHCWRNDRYEVMK